MRELKTCEEYVLNELAEAKAQLKEWEESRKSNLQMMDVIHTLLEIMSKSLSIHKAMDGKELITMGYIFEDYDPDEFKFLKSFFKLHVKEEKHE